ncbi:protein serine/threonine phosphatase 2C [Linnemannia elongata AG-77]|uniref:Protein serine/threonine phosphatase 2C n=1 Tax=Linnemannia elongata AG-77 TaxID=1314771 RepID=A0A197K1Z6_9FUNG|nr:protein serine/threonine phosphatase 2C [Linnemannia elongata AG-77]
MKNSQGDILRVHLDKYRDIVGLRSTRCQRKYNQDRYKVLVLDAPQLKTDPTITTTASTTATSSSTRVISQMDADHKTLFYFAIFDGHGGSNTADYLTANLDEYIEAAKPEMVPKVIKDLRKLGGYFRNFRPHFLEPFLPADFETKGSRDAADRARRQRRVHIPGKGGQVKPMIFIPHPNATEEEQEQELESLENQATAAGTSVKGATPAPTEVPLSEEQRKQMERAATNKARVEMPHKNEEHEYDEDDDPLVIAKRRNLNRTSPLPGGTTAYFGTDRSEYASLVLRAEDLTEKETRKQTATATATPAHIPTTMTLEQRLCLSFLQCDAELVRDKYRDGSTASVVIVQSKGAFWETKDDLDLILAHVGDTRILLCEAPRGESIQLTTDHHPDAIVEADRIRKMAAYVSADSFGENMFLGQLANTRALGDIAMKPFGVSAEPELIRRTVKAREAAFLVLISDGISSVMSNQEVVDCVKLEENPTQAAANVLNLAEQLGAEDNCTVMVVKLPAWGAKMPDLSKELREYRWQSEAQQSRARRR